MLIILEVILLGVSGFLFAYLALLSIAALTQAGYQCPSATRYRRFAVLIPAHNEESGIIRTVESALAVRYPRQWYDVVVIADNCTDRTAELAHAAGALVYERHDIESRGKGHALRWSFDLLLARAPRYDAILVIDADSLITENFLDTMNNYIEDGARVIQSADVVQSQQRAWIARVARLGFLLFNVARPLGRMAIRCSAGLRGNGMCFTCDTLRTIPWRAFSITEDLEYSLMLALNNLAVTFAPEAKVVATMPNNPKNAISQRTRWETGRIPLIRNFAGKLSSAVLRRGSLVALDALIDLVTPPIINLFSFCIAVSFLHVPGVVAGSAMAMKMMIGWLVVAGLGIVHVVLGLLATKADKDVYLALLSIPRYATWKFWVYARLIVVGRSREWVRTTREDMV